jgi:CheY-like chemotaxis protein
MILIAEDEIEIREAYQELLESYGYKVKAFSDGSEILSYLIKQELTEGGGGRLLTSGVEVGNDKLDLIITDLNMPGRSGEEMIGSFRGMSLKYQKVPIFVISGKMDLKDNHKFQSYGSVKFFPKPVSADTLLEQVSLMCPQDKCH